MKKAVFTLFCILFISSGGFCAENISAQIQKLEKNYFGYDYNGETTAQRLERLEKAVYGSASKDTIQNRLRRLRQDMPQYATAVPAPSEAVEEEAAYDELNTEKADADVKYPVVDKIEQEVFKKDYSGEDIYRRLSRLEKQVYKKESSAPLSERVDSLRASVLANARIRDDSSIVLEEYDPGMTGAASDLNSFSDESRYNYYTPQNTRNRVAAPASRFRTDASDANYDLDMLESEVLGRKFANEPVENRLARLENSVFQKTFSGSEDARIQRLLATTTAKKTARYYDNNKLMQHLNTGIQIGGIILMVLAMIL